MSIISFFWRDPSALVARAKAGGATVLHTVGTGQGGTPLQGRRNYLSLSRLTEEVEDALSENRLPPARAWALALLVRFAEASVHGNLEELGYIPQSLDDFLAADGGVWQVIASVRSSIDDPPAGPGQPDFYARARANAERADLVVVNHALLLNLFLQSGQAPLRMRSPFTRRVVCDEAHTLEEAATLALERRTEERGLRRLLRALHEPAWPLRADRRLPPQRGIAG